MEFRKYLEKSRKINGEKYLPKSIDLYVSYYDRYEKELLDNKNNFDGLIEFMNKIIKSQSNPYVKATFRQYLMFIGIPDDDDRLKLLKSSKKRASALTSQRVMGEKVIPIEDLKLLYDTVDDEWKLIIGFLYDTAIRENELLTLKWRKIKFYDEEINGISAEAVVLGKGSKLRTVFLTKKTCDLLKKMRPNIEDEDLVFQFRMGDGRLYKRQEKYLLDQFKKKTLEIIGKSYVIHSTRHSKLTHLSEKGLDILAIGSIAGHQDISTTNIYAKMSSKVAKRGYEKYSESL